MFSYRWSSKVVRFAGRQSNGGKHSWWTSNIMTKLNEVVERYKMRINKNKTKVMKIGKGEQEQLQIEIRGNILEQVHQFKYLGSMIAEDGRSEKEVRRRITLAKDAFTEHRMLLTKSLNQTLKKRLAKSLVWSVLLYGSEAWTLKKDDIRRLESFEMWVWRRMEKISWTERVRNEEVLRRVGEQRTLINTIRRRKARWTGHVIRSEGLLRTVIEGRAEGKRPRGRKRMMMLDDIKQGQTYHTMKRAALNREGWRRLTHAGPASGQNTWWWWSSKDCIFVMFSFR